MYKARILYIRSDNIGDPFSTSNFMVIDKDCMYPSFVQRKIDSLSKWNTFELN
jgi:hypothetical protein